MVIDEKQSENTNDTEEEVASSTNPKVMTVDESNAEVTPTAMVKSTLNWQSHSIWFSSDRNRKQHQV